MSQVLYLVQRCAQDRKRNPRLHDHGLSFLPTVPLRLFSDRAAAEAYRDELARRLWRVIDPFDLAYHVGNLTTVPEKKFVNCLWALGVVPPLRQPGDRPHDPLDWREWWKEALPSLSSEQLDAIWRQFDRLPLVEVVELPLDRG